MLLLIRNSSYRGIASCNRFNDNVRYLLIVLFLTSFIITLIVICDLATLYYVHFLCKKLIPHPLYDPTDFGSLSDLVGITTKEGLVVVISYIVS